MATRFWATFVVLSFVLVASSPVAAETVQYTRKQQCRRLTRQILHFEGTVLPMAEARGNDAWKQGTLDHLDRLKNRRADRCPAYAQQRGILAKAKQEAEEFRQLMVMAAKGAAKYFTGGWM